ncbi:hypothetical protein DFH08DRAFT_44158 [Mycena albidolilacea]|uniref:Uncharacterized protein n=1 Tax=Mycena albidolilacea TaxID=1033008 RepID=A0AAD7EWW8_9AGAR|nr:hypothetical protein DFH08DRAFT_44158 [Mycena albidolilacea]
MKFSILPIALACSGLVNANPLRVIVVSSHVSHGEAVSGADGTALVAHMRPVAAPQHAPCSGKGFRQKATGLADSLRIAFGFHGHNNDNHDNSQTKPLPFIALGHPVPAPVPAEHLSGEPWWFTNKAAVPEHARPLTHGPNGGHGRFRHHHHEEPSFLMRVHYALMSLGPWEGRAVAFVLGCGLGVLLRMVWVLAVVAVRVVRGNNSSQEQDEHEYAIVAMDAEEIFVAPPTYTYPVDEKAQEGPIAVAVPAAN